MVMTSLVSCAGGGGHGPPVRGVKPGDHKAAGDQRGRAKADQGISLQLGMRHPAGGRVDYVSFEPCEHVGALVEDFAPDFDIRWVIAAKAALNCHPSRGLAQQHGNFSR
jgi:hypothetical protein